MNEPPNRSDPKGVAQFPVRFAPERVAAQKRWAQQLMAQMPADPREQRAIIGYVNELIEWQESQNGDTPPNFK